MYSLHFYLFQILLFLYSIPFRNFMIKKRAQSKKKKIVQNQPRKDKMISINNNEKSLLRATSGLIFAKSNFVNANQPNVKQLKSPTSTPNSKTRKQSKQNIYQSIFNSKKTSETMTPLDYQYQYSQARSKNDFWFLFQIGSGGFGRVWKVQQKRSGYVYAMKQMSKAKVISKKSVNSIMNQKELLDQLSNPFIINSHEYFQDRENLYLVMQYLRGGDLRYHMCFYQYFDQQQTRFIVSCIILALQYIHSSNIIHRDLKPENIVFEENGYVRITDFGVARKKKQQNSEETSGTPGYMSPQVICRMNHSFQADYFALGVIIYQLIFGTRPYSGDSRKQIRQKILAQQAKINEKELPPGWSPPCVDFVNRLLKRNKQSRLGFNGIQQLKSHPWLKQINWVKLSKKQVPPPFVPGIICESYEYQRQMENSLPSEINQQTIMLLRTHEIQSLFQNYNKNSKKKVDKKQKPQVINMNSTTKFVRKVL